MIRSIVETWRRWRVEAARRAMLELYAEAEQDGTRASFRRYAASSHKYFDLRRYYRSTPL
jgi:hypothetical protein